MRGGREKNKRYRPGGAGTKILKVDPDGRATVNMLRHKTLALNARALLYNGFLRLCILLECKAFVFLRIMEE